MVLFEEWGWRGGVREVLQRSATDGITSKGASCWCCCYRCCFCHRQRHHHDQNSMRAGVPVTRGRYGVSLPHFDQALPITSRPPQDSLPPPSNISYILRQAPTRAALPSIYNTPPSSARPSSLAALNEWVAFLVFVCQKE